jgi:hypothetical protein
MAAGAGTTSQAKGAAYAAENTAISYLLPQATALGTKSTSLLDQYIAELEGFTSTSPTKRMEAAAPEIADATALAQGQKKQLANLPRGGESAYLSSMIDQNTVTAIGNALSKEFSSAISAEGQLSEWGISTELGAEAQAGELFLGAGGVFNQTGQNIAMGKAATEQMIAGLAGAAANAYS